MSENGKIIEEYNEIVNEAFDNYDFHSVINVLLELEKKVPSSKVIKECIGGAYFYLTDYENTIKYFEASMQCEEENLDYDFDFYSYMLSEATHYIDMSRKNIEKEKFQKENFVPTTVKDVEYSELWDRECGEHITESFSEDDVAKVESEFGYTLPTSYIAFLKTQNGGITKNCEYFLKYKNGKTARFAINEFFSLGEYDLDNYIANWGYPAIGLPICDCPSAGHDMIFLDYRKNGKDGIPQVSHIDQELNYEVTILADTFEEFLTNLHNRVNSMHFIKALCLEKYNNSAIYTLVEEDIYLNNITNTYVIALKTEIENEHDTQYPLEDLLEKHLVNCTSYSVVEKEGYKFTYSFEIEGEDLKSIYEFKKLVGKTVFNYKEGKKEKLGIE